MNDKYILKKLTDQHLIFIKEYILTNNQMLAAIKAGFSEKTAKTKASQLMIQPLIIEELNKQRDMLKQKWNIDKDFIINEYMEQILYAKELESETNKVIDSNLWFKSTQALSKTLGLDEPSKLDITSNGNSINIQYIAPTQEDNE